MKLRNDIYKIGGVILVIVLLSFSLSAFYTSHTLRILSVMMVTVGLVSFFGFIGLGVNEEDATLSKNDIRLATVVSLVTFYLALVGTVSMFVKDMTLPEITKTMITHFTTIIGVVIAFYFGTEAYMAVNKSTSDSRTDGESGNKSDNSAKEGD